MKLNKGQLVITSKYHNNSKALFVHIYEIIPIDNISLGTNCRTQPNCNSAELVF